MESKDCKHWCDGICGLTSAFMPTGKGLALNVWCRGANCPDYEPKEKKPMTDRTDACRLE